MNGTPAADGASERTIRVLLIDDHRMFTESMARLLADEADISVVGIASRGGEGVVLAAREQPDVVLVDHHMPDEDGVSVTARIKADHPDTKVVMVTGSADDRVLVAAIEAGCSGFITKDQVAGEIATAVRAAHAGDALITPTMLARLLPKLRTTERHVGYDLTPRELEVLDLLARGLPNKAIATQLYLSVNTVRNHVQSVLAKLDAHSKLEAVSTAVRAGIIAYPK
ncbi:MAG TPA: response regulator transcription factor [Mycobacteriales bacterium]|nr:response regulator transcription factor [Mycobacteriales bacterium]